jgi:hypothetical protein
MTTNAHRHGLMTKNPLVSLLIYLLIFSASSAFTGFALDALSSMPLGQTFIWCSIAMLFIVALVIPGKIQWRLIMITPVLVIALFYGKTLQYIDATENMLKIQESMTTQSLMTGDSTRSIMQSRIDSLESQVANLEREKQTFRRSC